MSYDNIDVLVKECGKPLPLTAKNELGENVIIEKGKDDCDEFYETTTAQSNNWCRINRFYKNGISTECFER